MDMIGQLAERDRKWREQLNEPDRSRLTELDKKQESLLRNLRATISDKHAFDRAIDHADKMARKICGS